MHHGAGADPLQDLPRSVTRRLTKLTPRRCWPAASSPGSAWKGGCWPSDAPFLDDPLAVQGKLCRRIERFIKELFVFVAEPDVPPDNNGAERSLRPLVTGRKISAGTRSEQGTGANMTLASLFGTWRARGLNPFMTCRQMLTSHQVSTVTVATRAERLTCRAAAVCFPEVATCELRCSALLLSMAKKA